MKRSKSAWLLAVGLIASASLPWLTGDRVPLPDPPPRGATGSPQQPPLLQHPPSRFEHPVFEPAVEIGAELSGAYLQDRDGFLWVGTFGAGLYRYDGSELVRYSATKGDLSGNNVTALFEDGEGRIWVGTLDGLDRYDKETGAFSAIELGEDARTGSAISGVWTLHGSGDGGLWVGTNGHGLLRLGPEGRPVAQHRRRPGDAASLPHDSVYRIAEDRKGRLWLATFGGGAARFDPAAGRVDLRVGREEGLASAQAWSVFVDGRGRVWIGTQAGLHRYEPTTEEVAHYAHVPGDPETLGGSVVTSIREDAAGTLWITSFDGDTGLSSLNPESGDFERYGRRSGPPGLGRRGARAVFEDASGIFWLVGMGGLSKLDPFSLGVARTELGSGVLPIYEDREGTLWLGTMAGLRRFDRERQRAVPVDHPRLSEQLVTALHEDDRGRFWLATYGGALLRFDRSQGRVVERHVHDPDDPHSLPASNTIRRIRQDVRSPHVLWLLTQGGGLARFDTRSGRTRRFQHDPDDPGSLLNDTASYGALLQDPDGSLWVGTDDGLSRLRPDAESFDHYRADPGKPESLRSDVIQSLHRDAEGELWVATAQGLHRLRDAEAGTFEHFGVEEGLAGEMVLGIVEHDERLWLSTPGGITAFDPEAGAATRVYPLEGGLRRDALLMTSFFKTRDGKIWFGGAGGVRHFWPGPRRSNDFVPPVVLTGLSQGGRAMELESAVSRTRSIRLDWPNNHFEFEMAALGFSRPEQSRYRYRLEGLDREWVESERGFGRYSGLEGGEYLLRIRASNGAGVWNERGTSLRVVVEPPFWRTGWFAALALALATLLAALAVRYVERLRTEVLQRRAAERHRDAAEARLREATRAEALGKLAAGVAHDFNNLLTVVSSEAEIAKERLQGGSRDAVDAALDSIESATDRGSELTRQLLAFSARRKSEPRRVRPENVIRDTARLLERLVPKQVELRLALRESLGELRADPGQIQQILMNLVVNAGHATPAGGTITVETFARRAAEVEASGAFPAGDFLGFSVADTGCGMDEATLARIFDPYFTTRHEGEGTGLGLATVREIVEQHGGVLDVRSAVGRGTTFFVLFPRAPD